MPQIKTLFLDLDNTLADDSGSLRLALAKVHPIVARLHPEISEETLYETFRRVNNKHWENYDDSPIAGMKNAIEIRAYIAGEMLEALDRPNPALARELAIAFQERRRETYRCFEDSVPVLQTLRENKIDLVLVTNGNSEMQREKIVRCNLEPLFDEIFIAQEAGVSKPSTRIFEMALESVNASADETMMVGDHPIKDVQGAQSAGLITAWIRRNGRDANAPGLNPDYIVHTMTEVWEIVQQHGI